MSARTMVPARLFRMADAAAELRVPEVWLRQQVELRRVSFERLGERMVRFSPEDIAAIVELADVEGARLPA